ncbi:thioesterase family protein [Actinoplanes sp. M2I2]|uniref:acyl-CoA thioesterase n=1 Tax=Actinoplanes sp. M2I2 TaxID=1734444 RepID=UPI0020208ABD|nr:acyl-CoA thioesterase [Actinoplanes sp. M2I2]
MKMLFRLFWLMLRARHRPRTSVWDTHQLDYRVRFRDLDLLRHMNNGVYLALLDLGRMDLTLRAGFWDQIRRHDIVPVVANLTIRYRKPLKLGNRFQVETRLAGVDDISVFFEQRIHHGGVVYAEGVVRQRFLRPGAGTVPIDELLQWVDPRPEDRVVAPWILQWAANPPPPKLLDDSVVSNR